MKGACRKRLCSVRERVVAAVESTNTSNLMPSASSLPVVCSERLEVCLALPRHRCGASSRWTAAPGVWTLTLHNEHRHLTARRLLYGDQARCFDDELRPHLKHAKRGTVGMASAGKDLNASQFYVTTADEITSLDEKNTVSARFAPPHPTHGVRRHADGPPRPVDGGPQEGGREEEATGGASSGRATPESRRQNT